MMDQLQSTLELIDLANQNDPETEVFNGQEYKKEYLYGLRMSEELLQYSPDCNELLQIAARAQHIRRWELKRSQFAAGRAGYLAWRKEQGVKHGEYTAEIMQGCGYNEQDCEKIKMLLSKKQLKTNADTQVLEDVICLVFIKYYLIPFAKKHTQDKLNSIILKTWNKMSSNAKQAALKINMNTELAEIISSALELETNEVR